MQRSCPGHPALPGDRRCQTLLEFVSLHQHAPKTCRVLGRQLDVAEFESVFGKPVDHTGEQGISSTGNRMTHRFKERGTTDQHSDHPRRQSAVLEAEFETVAIAAACSSP